MALKQKVEKTTQNPTNMVEEKKEVKKEVIKFLAWARNKATKELEEIEVEACSLGEVATQIRATGKYSFRIAATKENFEEAKKKWIAMNEKSIAYHAKKNNSNRTLKMKRLIELIKDMDDDKKKEIYEMFNLKNYEDNNEK